MNKVKYIKGNQKYKLKSCKLIKLDLHDTSIHKLSDGIFHERPWAKQNKDETHSVLQNDALAFTPFPSWGAIIPSIYSFDFGAMYNKGELTLHPEAWANYLKKKVIDKEGNFIVKQK